MSSPTYVVINQVKGTFPVSENTASVQSLIDFLSAAQTAGVTEVEFNVSWFNGLTAVIGIEFCKEATPA